MFQRLIVSTLLWGAVFFVNAAMAQEAPSEQGIQPAHRESPAHFRLHAQVDTAHALTAYQADEFGWGMDARALLEWSPVSAHWGFDIGGGVLWLSDRGTAPPTGLTAVDSAFGGLFFAGLRLRPWDSPQVAISKAGFWLAGHGGATLTGGRVRALLDFSLGYDFAFGSLGGLGPHCGYTQVIQPNSQPRFQDARVLSFGVHGFFAFHHSAAPISELLVHDTEGD
ncbi:MAG: hypothetical protein MK135_12915 [Polyangiaceae bacterium]|nr:hypothetical protein [Polyangiaceae bacterium]